MSRGVMTCSKAAAIVYVKLTDDDYETWDSFIEQVRWAVTEKWPSFYEDDYWVGHEERSILRNGLARIVICEYCGIASINLVPRDDLYENYPLQVNWCTQIAKNFHNQMKENFDCLTRLGTFSNGASIYKRA